MNTYKYPTDEEHIDKILEGLKKAYREEVQKGASGTHVPKTH